MVDKIKQLRKELVTVDLTRLEEEWQDQSPRFLTFAKRLAIAKKRNRDLEAELKVLMAQTDLKYRTSTPDSHGLPKWTEDALTNLVTTDKKVIDLRKEVNDSLFNIDMYKAATDTLLQRRDALHDLVVLHGQSYFSSPRAPKEYKEEFDRMEKTAILNKGKKGRTKK